MVASLGEFIRLSFDVSLCSYSHAQILAGYLLFRRLFFRATWVASKPSRLYLVHQDSPCLEAWKLHLKAFYYTMYYTCGSKSRQLSAQRLRCRRWIYQLSLRLHSRRNDLSLIHSRIHLYSIGISVSSGVPTLIFFTNYHFLDLQSLIHNLLPIDQIDLISPVTCLRLILYDASRDMPCHQSSSCRLKVHL